MTGGTYSIYRFGLGAAFAAGLGAAATARPVALDAAMLFAAALCSVAFAIGLRDRAAVPGVAAGAVLATAGIDPVHAALSLAPLLVHLALPPAPFGSFDALGRPDPRGDFVFPGWVGKASAVVVAGALLARAIAVTAEGPPATLDFVWGAGGLAYALFARIAPTRSLAFFGMVALLVARALLDPGEPWTAPLLAVHLLAFDGAFVPPLRDTGPDRVFYDGNCGLCHRTVRLALAEDAAGDTFRYAPLQGETFEREVPEDQRDGLPDSIVVITAGGRLLVRSDAALRIGMRLGGPWRALAALASLVPRGLRDAAYDGIAAVRHRLFPKPADVCPILPPPLRARFDY